MSRVAVHLPPGHPHGDPEQTVVVAFRLGRIRDGIDNLIIHTGEVVPIEEFRAGLFKQAQAEYPGAEVKLERLVDNGDGTARWIDAIEFDPSQHVPAGSGEGRAATVSVQSGQGV